MIYYANEADALSYINHIYVSNDSYTIATIGGFSSWRIASNSTGSSSQLDVYTAGTTLAVGGIYYLYPNTPCFLEGSKILCQVDGKDTYLPIETLKEGTLVKIENGYKPIARIGKAEIKNPGNSDRTENRLYKCSQSAYPDVIDDLYITGGHSILVSRLTDIQVETTKTRLGDIFVTGNKYRLAAFLDERAEPWSSEGTYWVWHLALENDNMSKNYGIWANGLFVETCSINCIEKRSNMIFIK
jgi:hypothetical protein